MGRRGEMPMRIGEVLFGPPFIYKYGVKNISKKKDKNIWRMPKKFLPLHPLSRKKALLYGRLNGAKRKIR